jgi:hypothetical protein
MLVWINGPFGGGKTAVAKRLVERDPEYRLFDPEWVGYMLRANLSDFETSDFQDLAPWSKLVPRVVAEIEAFTGHQLLAVQTVSDYAIWKSLCRGFDELRIDVFHVVLDVESAELQRRIRESDDRVAEQWRLDHIPIYEAARAWLFDDADCVIDTTRKDVDQVVAELLPAIKG